MENCILAKLKWRIIIENLELYLGPIKEGLGARASFRLKRVEGVTRATQVRLKGGKCDAHAVLMIRKGRMGCSCLSSKAKRCKARYPYLTKKKEETILLMPPK